MPSTTCLADTNVLSELFRPDPNPGVVAWAEGLALVYVSVVSIEEIHYGLAWKPHPKVRDHLESFLDAYCEVLPITEEIARHAGYLRGELQRRGTPRDQADMLIGATVSIHRLTLVTRNVKDFEDCGIHLLDPFR